MYPSFHARFVRRYDVADRIGRKLPRTRRVATFSSGYNTAPDMNRSSEVANTRRGVFRAVYSGSLAVRNNAARSRIRAFRTAAFRKLGQLSDGDGDDELGRTPDWIPLKGPNRTQWRINWIIALLLARFVALYGGVTRFNRWKLWGAGARAISWKSLRRLSKSFAAQLMHSSK